jgi:hypothetical protein
MTAARRFAEDTIVPVARSQDQVKTLLRQAGSDQIAVYEAAEQSAVAFRVAGRFYRINVPVKPKSRNPQQEERRAWRLLLLLIKAKLEAVREGATTIEREFLADMLTPDGQTVAEWIKEPLKLAYETGRMPTQLLLPGSHPG